MITAAANEFVRMSECSNCNGYGWVYVKYSDRYDEAGNYIHDWTPCEECTREGKQ